MRKFIYGIVFIFIGILITLIFLFWYKCFPEGTAFDLKAFATWVGAIGSFGAIFVIILNTNKQIRNQNNNIKKQIKNQNKENNRPFITVNRSYEKSSSESNCPEIYKVVTESANNLGKRKPIELFLEIKNIGNGVAINIELNKINENDIIDNGDASGKHFTHCDLGINASNKIQMQIEYGASNNKNNSVHKKYVDSINFLLFYSDIYDSIYSTILDIRFTTDGKFIVLRYNCGSTDFDDAINSVNGNYDEKIKKYKKRYLNIRGNLI